MVMPKSFGSYTHIQIAKTVIIFVDFYSKADPGQCDQIFVNFRLLGDCLLCAVFFKLQK
jgi:hypothetical protein